MGAPLVGLPENLAFKRLFLKRKFSKGPRGDPRTRTITWSNKDEKEDPHRTRGPWPKCPAKAPEQRQAPWSVEAGGASPSGRGCLFTALSVASSLSPPLPFGATLSFGERSRFQAERPAPAPRFPRGRLRPPGSRFLRWHGAAGSARPPSRAAASRSPGSFEQRARRIPYFWKDSLHSPNGKRQSRRREPAELPPPPHRPRARLPATGFATIVVAFETELFTSLRRKAVRLDSCLTHRKKTL